MRNITIRYAGGTYPNIAQDSNFAHNIYTKFYREFIEVARSLGFRNPALSYNDFKNLYTIFSFDLSAAPQVASSVLSITFERRELPGGDEASNPLNVTAYIIVLTSSKIEIEAQKKTVRKLS